MTAAEPTLWEYEHLTRYTDRPHVRAAAGTVDVNAREGEVIDALRVLSVASSAHEIQQKMAAYGIVRQTNCVSRRLTSLVRKGRVVEVGTKPGPYGRDVTAYALRNSR